MWALRKFLPQVRVPEVYGWRRDGHELFLFMELIQGDTLLNRWKDLTEQEKTQVCTELDTMVRALRRLVRPPEDEFIGKEIILSLLRKVCIYLVRAGVIGGQPSMDTLCFGQMSRPFPNSVAFYEFLMKIPISEHPRGVTYLSLLIPQSSSRTLIFSNILITPHSSN
jgi:hypothetical protein